MPSFRGACEEHVQPVTSASRDASSWGHAHTTHRVSGGTNVEELALGAGESTSTPATPRCSMALATESAVSNSKMPACRSVSSTSLARSMQESDAEAERHAQMSGTTLAGVMGISVSMSMVCADGLKEKKAVVARERGSGVAGRVVQKKGVAAGGEASESLGNRLSPRP